MVTSRAVTITDGDKPKAEWVVGEYVGTHSMGSSVMPATLELVEQWGELVGAQLILLEDVEMNLECELLEGPELACLWVAEEDEFRFVGEVTPTGWAGEVFSRFTGGESVGDEEWRLDGSFEYERLPEVAGVALTGEFAGVFRPTWKEEVDATVTLTRAGWEHRGSMHILDDDVELDLACEASLSRYLMCEYGDGFRGVLLGVVDVDGWRGDYWESPEAEMSGGWMPSGDFAFERATPED